MVIASARSVKSWLRGCCIIGVACTEFSERSSAECYAVSVVDQTIHDRIPEHFVQIFRRVGTEHAKARDGSIPVVQESIVLAQAVESSPLERMSFI